MRRYAVVSSVLVGAVALGGVIFSTQEYKGWHHVKSMVIYSDKHPLYNPFGGIHHVYANGTALKAVKKSAGRKFPDGSVVAFLLYEAKESGGAYTEGRKKIEAFMVKDSRRYKDTGGWGFFAYDGSGRSLVKNMKRDCFSCHTQARELDYVFSLYKE
ncbi:cytochrome P460 family protein [Hydrogenivirga sp.]